MRSYYTGQDITSVRIPTVEEERQMFAEYRERRTAKRREKIVRCYLQFALQQARRDMGLRAASVRSRAGLSEDDSISAANLGLMTAVDRFDPSRGFRFTTYAGFWIFKYLLEARYSAHQIVVSDAEKRLFSRLSAMRRRMGLTDEEISLRTGLSEREIDNVMSLAKGRCDAIRYDSEENENLLRKNAAADVDLLVDSPEQSLESRERIELLRGLVEKLPKQSREVVQARFFKGLRNEQIARRFALSIHSVERILREAKEQLRSGFPDA